MQLLWEQFPIRDNECESMIIHIKTIEIRNCNRYQKLRYDLAEKFKKYKSINIGTSSVNSIVF